MLHVYICTGQCLCDGGGDGRGGQQQQHAAVASLQCVALFRLESAAQSPLTTSRCASLSLSVCASLSLPLSLSVCVMLLSLSALLCASLLVSDPGQGQRALGIPRLGPLRLQHRRGQFARVRARPQRSCCRSSRTAAGRASLAQQAACPGRRSRSCTSPRGDPDRAVRGAAAAAVPHRLRLQPSQLSRRACALADSISAPLPSQTRRTGGSPHGGCSHRGRCPSNATTASQPARPGGVSCAGWVLGRLRLGRLRLHQGRAVGPAALCRGAPLMGPVDWGNPAGVPQARSHVPQPSTFSSRHGGLRITDLPHEDNIPGPGAYHPQPTIGKPRSSSGVHPSPP